MRIIKTTAAQWGVQLPVREVLREAGNQHQAGQGEGGINAGVHSQIQGRTEARGNTSASLRWAGQGLGVRGPMQDETPLSQSEAQVLLRHLCELEAA